MKVELTKLKPNPRRDFKIDPIDEEKVKELVASIKQDGFWSGVTARKKDGELETAAGHTRIKAALEAGETHADIFVGDWDDQAMIRVYARENATQRGNSGLAVAGSVASALKYLLKGVLTDDKRLSQFWDSPHAFEQLKKAIASEKGLGAPIILEFLAGIPGINKSIVTHQIANLKASGDYARIVAEVDAEIAKEQEAELERLKQESADEEEVTTKTEKQKRTRGTSKKAKEASSKQTPTFDFEGVAKHLKNENQIRVFREVCERESMKKYLPVNKQAALAKELVRKAKATGEEISGTYLKDNMVSMMMDAAQAQGQLDKEARESLEKQDARIKWTNTSHHFARQVGGISKDGRILLKMVESYPHIKFRITTELRVAIKYAQETVNKLASKLENYDNEDTDTRTRKQLLPLGNRA